MLADSGFRLVDAYDGRHPPALAYVSLDLTEGMLRLAELHARGVICVAMSGRSSVALAVQAMQKGAADFLPKPFSRERFLQTLSLLRAEAERPQTPPVPAADVHRDFCGFTGASAPMQKVYAAIRRVAPSRAFVFITGESGTGKELCAQAIHRLSPRKNRPFIAINCAAIPRDLMESEIFGHVRGAYTGAIADRAGAAEQADGGTLFLDEIAEMDLLLQAKLLRFLQTGAFQKIGGSRLQTTDLRIICATNRDPAEEVRRGRLRQDLFYRLHVVPVHMPRLGDRDEDVVMLAAQFLNAFAAEEGKVFTGFDPGARAALLAHDWPGNVRQLQNAIRHAVVMGAGGVVTAAMLGLPEPDSPPPAIPAGSVKAFPQLVRCSPPPVVAETLPLWQVEKEAIEAAIARCGGNIPRAAALLEISPSTIYRKKLGWERGETGEKTFA